MNKTERKNQINLTVNWPEKNTLFTVKDLTALNPQFKAEITLRVRLEKAIKNDKTVAVIGYKNVGKGRPVMILAMHPFTQELLDQAYNSGIQPPDSKPVPTIIPIMDISTSSTPASADNIEISTETPEHDTISTATA